MATADALACTVAAGCASGSGGGENTKALPPNAKRLGPRSFSVYAKPDVRLTGFYQDAMVKADADTSGTTAPAPTSQSYR